MMDPILLEELTQVFRQTFLDNQLIITPATKADDVRQWDSFSHMELIAAIEKKYNIQFSFEEVIHFNNVGDLINTLTQKIKAAR